MHDVHLGRLGQGSTGSRFRIIAEKGRRAQCPPGTSQESGGRLGTGQQYAWCWRAPQFAPPPVTTTTISVPTSVSVPTSLQTQISPQVSPVLTQAQASPGAQFQAQPTQVAPAPMTRQTGITAADLERIMRAQSEARIAEEEARERKRTAETSELRRQMAERTRASEEIAMAQRAGEMRRIEQERFAREQAELTARESAAAIPPPPSFAPPSPLQPAIQAAAPIVTPMMTPGEQVTEIDVAEGDVIEAGMSPMMLIIIAAAGLGVVLLAGGKKGKRRKKR